MRPAWEDLTAQRQKAFRESQSESTRGEFPKQREGRLLLQFQGADEAIWLQSEASAALEKMQSLRGAPHSGFAGSRGDVAISLHYHQAVE